MAYTKSRRGRNEKADNSLQPLNQNVVLPVAPVTPGKQGRTQPVTPGKKMKILETKLEEKDSENEALRSTISDLTNALNGLTIVKQKIDSTVSDGHDHVNSKKNKKKDEDAPQLAKSAFKFFAENNAKQTGADMRPAWKECSPEVRKIYTSMADADKARYKVEFAIYEEQKVALDMYYANKKQSMALELYEAELVAQSVVEKAAGATDKKIKKKVKKDPEAPKRSLSAYMYFAIEKRASVAEANSNDPPKDILRKVGNMWQELGTNAKEKYEDLAASDKVRYEAEKAKYDAMITEKNIHAEQERLERKQQDKEAAMELMKNLKKTSLITTDASGMDDVSAISDEAVDKKKKTKKKKDPNAPKQKLSAYNFFYCENRAQIKSGMPATVTNSELMSEVGRQWKEFSDKDKQKYNKMADTDKARHSKEMEIYNATRKDQE